MSKKLLLSIVAALLIVPVMFQLSAYGASAQDVNPPSSFANLVGQITYRQLGRLVGNTQRITPAANVSVTVQGFFDRSMKVQTTTDSSGNYSVDVPAGLYTVDVNENTATKTNFFTPPFRVERVQDDQTKDANFQGLVF